MTATLPPDHLLLALQSSSPSTSTSTSPCGLCSLCSHLSHLASSAQLITMSGPPSRIRSILGHLLGPAQPPPHIHHLSPTFFLERAALVEPNADAIFHITPNGVALRRSYQTFADRARGLAYYLKKHKLSRIGILAPNTPAFLESIYGIVAGGGVMVPANYRLKEDDIAYIFEHADVDCIIVDKEFEGLLGVFTKKHPNVPLIVDLVSQKKKTHRLHCRLTLLEKKKARKKLPPNPWSVVGHGCHRGSILRPVQRSNPRGPCL